MGRRRLGRPSCWMVPPSRSTPSSKWRSVGGPWELGPGARTEMVRSRNLVDQLLASEARIYGVTTGFGRLASVVISADQQRDLQKNLVRSHSAGFGDPSFGCGGPGRDASSGQRPGPGPFGMPTPGGRDPARFPESWCGPGRARAGVCRGQRGPGSPGPRRPDVDGRGTGAGRR